MNRPALLIALASTALSLAGCATYNPIPDGYTGPKATIKESFKGYSSSKADFFYVDSIDGHDIDNSRTSTISRNQGRGVLMTPYLVEREVPATECTLRLVGRTMYAAPILELTNTVYQVKGDIHFLPEAGKTYTVKGVLDESNSAVWLEDESGDVVSGTKVESAGSAKLGFFTK